MNIQVAVLCDAATESSGKLNLLGAFDAIYAQQLPVIHPMCAVALRMTFSNAEEGAHQFTLNFVDEDGHAIMPAIDLPIQVTLPDDAHFVTRNIIVNYNSLKFDKPGLYSLDLALDGQQQASIPLLIKADLPKE